VSECGLGIALTDTRQIQEDLAAICCVVGAECKSAGIAARTLANIADVLGAMSRGCGGLRSGPACNKQWNFAFQLLEVR